VRRQARCERRRPLEEVEIGIHNNKIFSANASHSRYPNPADKFVSKAQKVTAERSGATEIKLNTTDSAGESQIDERQRGATSTPHHGRKQHF
jgi:hypothetical protein